jgi:hypothetical protein
MPAVIDTSELIEIEQIDIHDLTIEQPPARQARPGFWGMLAHRLTTYLTHALRKRHAPMDSIPRPFEMPLDRFVREYPSVALYALAII